MKEHQHEPLYANSPDTRLLLREQDWVKLYEKASCANEPTRIKDAHATKAKGTTAGELFKSTTLVCMDRTHIVLIIIDTYTTDETKRISNYTLQAFGPALHNTHLGLRDRALFLIPTNTAFRGDSTRRVLWSDFFSKSIPMPLIHEDAELDVSYSMSTHCLLFTSI